VKLVDDACLIAGVHQPLVPELVEWRWYYYFLHNQRASAMRLLVHAKGTGRIIVISVPSYIRS
jgi:hypothetical protein